MLVLWWGGWLGLWVCRLVGHVIYDRLVTEEGRGNEIQVLELSSIIIRGGTKTFSSCFIFISDMLFLSEKNSFCRSLT